MKKIVIVGGGTSGLIAAAMMDNYWKDNVNITLIYDPDNKNISVGEGTTPGFVDLFEETLGHTRQDSIKKLDATIKLGILFKNWIPDEEYYHGFSQVNIEHVDDNYSSIHSLLNDCYDGGINFNHANGLIPENIDDDVAIAFHITADNISDFLFDYLKDRITIVDDKISRVTSDGKNIQSVTGKNTGNYHADLFVDASGFKSILLNELNPEWVDLSQHLPIDSAIPFKVPNNTNSIPTYTLSEATKNGWIWQIPTQDRFGTGYLYSSQFTTDDEAREDYNKWLLYNHGVQLDTDRIIKWKTGYYKDVWIGNCFAVGLSGGFTEPLEALSHQYLIFMLEIFMSMNSTLKSVEYNRNRLNRCQERFFFDITNFINLHYCTNRNDSPFWKHMTNNKTEWVAGIEDKCKEEFIDLFKTDDMLDHWDNDNFIQIMEGLHIFNKESFREYINSRKNSEYLHSDAKKQHEYITGVKNSMTMIDHKEYLNSLKLPFI
tara:strand:+ start:2186 stop:3652 length:1467 start_codon:yes stop_codon:yes gene_type:complete